MTSGNTGKSILIIAGESSGDNVGGLLCAELKLLRPDIELFGIGGDSMDMSGTNLRYHTSQLSFLGFWEVLKHLPFMKKVEKDILEQIELKKPSLAILIDYPGFNLRLAGKLKRIGIPVMYYVSPQVWAWGRGRIEKIKRLVDKMVVVFEFEKEMYRVEGLAAEWYGHPLLEIVGTKYSRDDFLKRNDRARDERYIGLFPGSRKQEIQKILPVMIDSLWELSQRGTSLRGIIGGAPGIDDDIYRQAGGENVQLVRAQTYDLMTYSELNLVASGTATLECAILGRPLFVLYKTSPITYNIARRLIKIPYVGLVNVIAGEKVAPEFIQGDCRPGKIAAEMHKYFSTSTYRDSMLMALCGIKSKLGETGASGKVAELALSLAGF